jgi:hypothetical protein
MTMTAPTRNTALMICTLIVFLAGCSTRSYLEQSLREHATDLQVNKKGDVHFVATRDGNLAGATVFSTEERQVQLEEFINTYKADFGITSNDHVVFVQDSTEFDFEFGDKIMTGLPLLQSINGLRILELEQLGVFDLESGSLKAAKIRIADPASLRGVSIPKHTDTIQSFAGQFLQDRGIACDKITIFDKPAYSLAAGMAGFEARCTARPNSQYRIRLRLLVNPESGNIAMLSREEIDLATLNSPKER